MSQSLDCLLCRHARSYLRVLPLPLTGAASPSAYRAETLTAYAVSGIRLSRKALLIFPGTRTFVEKKPKGQNMYRHLHRHAYRNEPLHALRKDLAVITYIMTSLLIPVISQAFCCQSFPQTLTKAWEVRRQTNHSFSKWTDG